MKKSNLFKDNIKSNLISITLYIICTKKYNDNINNYTTI